MLLQFVVENFLSFRDAATLSMVAAETIEHAAGQTVRGPEGLDVLRCAALYGANASGKSNLVRALDFARDLILQGTRSGQPIPVRPFKLDPSLRGAPSRFELEVAAGHRHYSYGFAVTHKEVQAEWLHVADGDAEQMLFERETSGPTAIKIGEALATDKERRQFLRFVAEGTRPNQLFLSEAQERNVTELDPLLEALRSLRVVWPHATASTYLAQRLLEDTEFRRFLGNFIKSAGTGLEDIDVERSEVDPKQLSKDLLEVLQEGVGLLGNQGDLGMIRSVDVDKFEALTLQGVHRARGDQLVKFDLAEESDGTRRLVHLSPALYLLGWGEQHEPTFVIDELERSLHPLLTRLFLERFLTSGSPDTPSQLIFTTHDTNLLDLSLLSRDSIWFTEKDPHGASTLYSLAEFKADQLDQLGPSLEQGYLQGRFGAIPFLGDPEKLRWTKLKAGQP